MDTEKDTDELMSEDANLCSPEMLIKLQMDSIVSCRIPDVGMCFMTTN